jgi:F-type H+-transporting ATPase subunit epsilon
MNLVPLDIVTPDRKVFEGPVHLVVAKTGGGEIGIMPGHSPIMGTVKPCVVKVKTQDNTLYFAVAGGFLEVTPVKITLLADAAELGSEIDL